MSFNHLAAETIQQIVNNLSKQDVLSLSVTCHDFREIGLSYALYSHSPRIFDPRRFISFVEFVLADTTHIRATYLRSLTIRNESLECYREQEPDYEDWVYSLTRLLQRASRLHKFSIGHWHELARRYPDLGAALHGAKSVQQVELREPEFYADMLDHLPKTLYTLCIKDFLDVVSGLHSLLVIVTSLPHLHTLELQDVIIEDAEDCTGIEPGTSTSLRRLVITACTFPVRAFVCAFPEVNTVQMWNLKDGYLRRYQEGREPWYELANEQWKHLDVLHTDWLPGDWPDDLLKHITKLQLELPCIRGGKSVMPQRQLLLLMRKADARFGMPSVLRLHPEFCPEELKTIADNGLVQWMAPVVKTLRPLCLSFLELRFPFSNHEIKNIDPGAVTELLEDAPQLSKEFVAALLQVAKRLRTVEQFEIVLLVRAEFNGDEIEVGRRQWKFEKDTDGRREAREI